MNKPALSVTILNYNYARYLPRVLDAILAQTFTDFEVILIDDCSPESPAEVIAPYLSDVRVRYVQHTKNLGFPGSLIEGTEVYSRGDFLTVISADDLVLSEDAFKTQMELMAPEDVALCFSAVARVFDDGTRDGHHSMSESTTMDREEAFNRFLFDDRFWAMHSGAIVRKSAYERAGGYRRDLTMPLDLALFLKVCLEGRTAYADTELYGYGVHPGQMSSSKFRQNAREVQRIINDAATDGRRRFGMDAAMIRRRALQRQLQPILINEAYTGAPGAALRAIAAWLRVAPLTTLTARATWIALSRTLLGQRGTGSLQTVRRRLRQGHAS